MGGVPLSLALLQRHQSFAWRIEIGVHQAACRTRSRSTAMAGLMMRGDLLCCPRGSWTSHTMRGQAGTATTVVDELARKSLSTDLSYTPAKSPASFKVAASGKTYLHEANHSLHMTFDSYDRDVMEQHGIKSSYLTCLSGTEFAIEPRLYWRDELGDFRLSLIAETLRRRWQTIAPEPEKRRVALEQRDRYNSHGCCHLQIGKYYPFQELIANEPLKKLLNGVKDLLDPKRNMNLGSLGLR